MSTTPLRSVKDQFKGKTELVAAVRALATDKLWLDRVNDTKGLGRVSNKKLLRLHRALSDAKERFGSREKLITSILEIEQRPADAGYQTRLEGYPVPRLLDLLASASRRMKRLGLTPKTSKEKPAKVKPAKETPVPEKAPRKAKAEAPEKAAAKPAETEKKAAPEKAAAAPARKPTAKAPPDAPKKPIARKAASGAEAGEKPTARKEALGHKGPAERKEPAERKGKAKASTGD